MFNEPINHDGSTCGTCGGTLPVSLDGRKVTPHSGGDCFAYQRFLLDSLTGRVKRVEQNDRDTFKVVTGLHGRIIVLENTNKDISSLLRKALLRIDSLAGDISKLYKANEKARPKKDKST